MLANSASFLVSHRRRLALKAKENGWRVIIAAGLTSNATDLIAAARLHDDGFDVLALDFPRAFGAPSRNIRLLAQILGLLRRSRPEVLVNISLKPIALGTLAARISGVQRVVNVVTGLGHLFIDQKLRTRLARRGVIPVLRVSLQHPDVTYVYQNEDDRRDCEHILGFAGVRSVIVPGVGVDTDAFSPAQTVAINGIVVLPARLTIEKGVREFVEAARIVKGAGTECRFALVGEIDTNSRARISIEQIRAWESEGAIEWWGFRDNMCDVFRQATLVCLPSYREGFPLALAEAAAVGIPVVTTDVAGCRDVVQHGLTGLLVPPRTWHQLASAIDDLLRDPQRRSEMGKAARAVALERFGADAIDRTMLDLFNSHVTAMPPDWRQVTNDGPGGEQ